MEALPTISGFQHVVSSAIACWEDMEPEQSLVVKRVTLCVSTTYTRGDQKVCGKVLLNRIAFIDCNENS